MMRSSEVVRKWAKVAEHLRHARNEAIALTNELPDGDARSQAREVEMQIQSAREHLNVLHGRLEELFEEVP